VAHLRENLAAAGLQLPKDKLAVLNQIGSPDPSR
jgi:aryl-alcohol dehydrogenase-like predicted oxidoreductase